MKRTQICPKCQHRKFLVVRPFQLPNPKYSNSVFEVPVASAPRKDEPERDSAGQFEAWVCAACGLTEWYAYDLHELLRGAQAVPGNARLVDADAHQAPFR